MLQTQLESLHERVCALKIRQREHPGEPQDELIADIRRRVEELQIACASPGRSEEIFGASHSSPTPLRPLRGSADDEARQRVQPLAEGDVRIYQERARALMTALLLTEEHERRRLAVDLHDGLSQTIALTQIKLSALRRSVGGSLVNSVQEIEELVSHTNSGVRSISFELSPPVLHDFGLEPAIQWLVENIQSRYGITIALEDDGRSKPIDEATRVVLFRSIRELLINAAKHARASQVSVRLARDEDRLNAVVEDDGVGMETETAGGRGFGLFSIFERLTHVGGSMRIESAPGRGTKIQLCAALAKGAAPLEMTR